MHGKAHSWHQSGSLVDPWRQAVYPMQNYAPQEFVHDYARHDHCGWSGLNDEAQRPLHREAYNHEDAQPDECLPPFGYSTALQRAVGGYIF